MVTALVLLILSPPISFGLGYVVGRYFRVKVSMTETKDES